VHFFAQGNFMQLSLEGISKTAGPETWLYNLSLAPAAGAVTVLLGATQSGKTSLMRIMAGLDTPQTGQVRVDGNDVTGMPVRQRNVAMVYQQFINYPSLKVRDNIASPLKLRGETGIDARVQQLAQKLHIEAFLDRYPAELSGGQQQRVALARALAKNAPLMLLDEPLVNLDYKLREELREELSTLFASQDSTVIYATTEPGEALLMGGYTAVLDAGELLQYGPTAEVFHYPDNLRVARAFSDPPLNLVQAQWREGALALSDAQSLPVALPLPTATHLTLGFRAADLHTHHGAADVAFSGAVELAEISGSDTFVHVVTPMGELVAQLTGVHYFDLGSPITLYFDPRRLYVFGADGVRLLAPSKDTLEGRHGAH